MINPMLWEYIHKSNLSKMTPKGLYFLYMKDSGTTYPDHHPIVDDENATAEIQKSIREFHNSGIGTVVSYRNHETLMTEVKEYLSKVSIPEKGILTDDAIKQIFLLLWNYKV